MNKDYQIIEFSKEWYSQSVDLLTDTFLTYPTFKLLTKSTDEKHNKLTRELIKLKMIIHEILHHRILLIVKDNDLMGICIFEGIYKKIPYLKIFGLIPKLYTQTNLRTTLRTLRYFIYNLGMRKKVSNKFNHLSVLAINKKNQGNGMGRALLEEVHKIIEKDKSTKGITLETSDKSLLGFYKKFSYSIYESCVFKKLPVFHLIREK